MSWPFAKAAGGAIKPEGRLLGLTKESGVPIWAPSGHSLTLAAAGAGKSTRGAMVWIMSLLASYPNDAMMISDAKEGELAAQLVPMLIKMGRKVAVIDDMGVRPDLATYRVPLNAFASTRIATETDPEHVLFASESITHALVSEPKDGDAKNKYWRAWPRNLLEFAHHVSLERTPESATPGSAALILSDPETLMTFAEIEAEEGAPFVKSLAKSILDMRHHEHWPQHLEEAQRAMRIFMPGSKLHNAGLKADKTHADLIREGYIVLLVGPQAYMNRLNAFYSLHIQSFFQALYAGAGKLRFICDEFSNTPLSALAETETTIRAYGGEVHKIAQSRSEIIRKFGEQETRTLEENAVVKQWLGFSSFEEAERASKAMGEQFALSEALGGDANGLRTNTNLSLMKQPVLTPAELMAMPRDEQLIHIKGVGFFVARTISQNQIAPFCDLLAANPLEGGRLPSDPILTLKLPEGAA